MPPSDSAPVSEHGPELTAASSAHLFQSNSEDPWTNFTTRLRKGTKERLQRLCLERQIAKAKPWGQQDLVEEAIVWVMNKYAD